MSYLQFHLVFLLPPLFLLTLTLPGSRRRLKKPIFFIFLLALIAFVYTTPWDNYLVWRGIWAYGSERVIATIGYVPAEEYAFFILQPLLTGMWLYLVLGRARAPRFTDRSVRTPGAAVYGAATLVGLALLWTERGLYAGLILAWAGPVLCGQWFLAHRAIWANRQAAAIGVAIPTIYLWTADAFAIRNGIWAIAEATTTGVRIGPLPIEEALFFLLTNLLVVQGLLLFLYPPEGLLASRDRALAGAP